LSIEWDGFGISRLSRPNALQKETAGYFKLNDTAAKWKKAAERLFLSNAAVKS
jgi:hypothetical protein